jgi:hypothetical protein
MKRCEEVRALQRSRVTSDPPYNEVNGRMCSDVSAQDVMDTGTLEFMSCVNVVLSPTAVEAKLVSSTC